MVVATFFCYDCSATIVPTEPHLDSCSTEVIQAQKAPLLLPFFLFLVFVCFLCFGFRHCDHHPGLRSRSLCSRMVGFIEAPVRLCITTQLLQLIRFMDKRVDRPGESLLGPSLRANPEGKKKDRPGESQEAMDCENSGLEPPAVRASAWGPCSTTMLIKLAKTRKQTKFKFYDLTSLSLLFLSTRDLSLHPHGFLGNFQGRSCWLVPFSFCKLLHNPTCF